KAGDKWSREAVEPVPPFGAFLSKLEYEYVGTSPGGPDPLHVISCKVETKYRKPKEDAELFRVVKGELSGEEGEGSFLFDAEAGRLVRCDKSMVVRGQLTIEANE